MLTYPFVGTEQLDALGVPADDDRRRAVRLVNPLSDEQPFMRTNLLVTLLDTARRNVGRGATDVAIFETGLVTRPLADAPAAPQLPGGVRPSDAELAAIDAAVPPQPRRVAGVLAGAARACRLVGVRVAAPTTPTRSRPPGSSPRCSGVDLTVTADADHMPWHPGRCARLTVDGVLVGHAGELHPNVVAAHGLPARAVAFELDLDALLAAAPTEPYQASSRSRRSPWPRRTSPSWCPRTSPPPTCSTRSGSARSRPRPVTWSRTIRLFDVYEGEQVGAGNRSLAFALRLRADDRTLTAQETAGVREAVVAEAHRRFGATLRA